MPLLHGDLEVEVVGGEELEDRDEALFGAVPGDRSDVLVTVSLGGTAVLETGVRRNARSAVWGDRVSVPVCQEADSLEVAAWDEDHLRREPIGRGLVSLGDALGAWRRDGPVVLDAGGGRIDVRIGYAPASGARREGVEVPRAYNAMREGGSLTLYRDAHASGIPGGAFGDMAEAIRRAARFVYVAAWSLWTGLRLERREEAATTTTLGELLKRKAAEGVAVLVLIWDERFSAGLCAGLLSTYDEDTFRYFEGTGVRVAKARRQRGGRSLLREKLAEVVWTHHQKAVVSDDGAGGVVGFLGGLDPTRGRWDTPEHHLFSTLAGDHLGDFHNGFVELGESQGPREPWHDVHCRVTGPAAVDLLRNFEERWRRQAPGMAHRLLALPDEALETPSGAEERVSWQMQVVRTIDGDSALFDKNRTGLLDNSLGRLIDTSLYRALVRLIRKAEKFIYIESQYFIGSSQSWGEEGEDPDTASNLVPLEIAEKVASKIRNGEDFRVYILLPMIPEGNPDHTVVRCSMNAILYYQRLTLQMMYRRIAAALEEAGSENHPTDYLLVLCLGKKESRSRVSRASGVEAPAPGSEEAKWRGRSRFLIYVHSKVVVADDSFVLLGSANLNQRSLDGSRDTEVAVSACQVRRREGGEEEEKEAVGDGAVKDFRRSLWSEHTSGLSEEEGVLRDPSSLEAMRRLRRLADEALDAFVGDEDVEPRCRFLRFPFDVAADGTIRALSGMPNVPDFDLPALGCRNVFPSTPTV